MEKVIFREEKDGGFLAVFPEDYAIRENTPEEIAEAVERWKRL